MKRIDEIFDYQNGLASSNVNIVDEKLGPNFIHYLRPSKSMGNLLAGYVDKTTVDNKYVSPAFSIVVSTDAAGSHTYSYVYPYEFIGNSNTIALYPKNPDMTLEERLFYSMAITSNRYKFDYARKPKGERLLSLLMPEYIGKLKLSNNVMDKIVEMPNYAVEEGYDKACWFLENIDFDDFEKRYKNPILAKEKNEVIEYKDFFVDELFKVVGAKNIKKEDVLQHNPGIFPYVTKKATDNGVEGFYDFYTEEGNVITISDITPYCSYQEKPFISTSHVHKLIPKFQMTPYIAMYLVTVLQKEDFRYCYGRLFGQDKIKKTKIKLPCKLGKNSQFEPDWAYMENYIKSLPYSSAL